uniref:Uncharacterized protein n=1 Tax=Meloidogyne enterolobii TaxID=390850 RepID=A0A6V7UCM7_MELEN|nr:unnamed protein product [Meloidogyne enterolobii]
MAGAFALFEALGIENTFSVNASIFFPVYFQLLDFDIIKHIEGGNIIPEFNFPKPGDWIEGRGGNRYYKNERIGENLEAHNKANNFSKYFFEVLDRKMNAAMGKTEENNEIFFENLFGKIKYHFVNQNKFANFEAFPEHEKIIYIGGILVEGNENIDITTVKNFVCYIKNIKTN